MTLGETVTVMTVDCSRYSEERYSPECEERSDIGVGVLMVGSLLVLIVGYVLWRVLATRYARRNAEAS